MRYRWFLNLLCVTAVFCSCNRIKPQIPSNIKEEDPTEVNLLEFNRLCIDDEKREIEAYTDSAKTDGNGDFTITEDGYLYRVITAGDSTVTVKNGSEISIAYSVELLDGTVCYHSSEMSRPKNLIVGKRVLGKGIDLAVMGRHLGDDIELILPYNLAYGVAGDRECIPPRTPILYRMKILSVR